MYINEDLLMFIIYAALLVCSCTPVFLLYFLFKDLKHKSLW